MRRYFFIAIFPLLTLFCVAISAYAQIIPDPFSVSADPQSPSPGETVTIEARTPSTDGNTVFFNWAVDGKPYPQLSGYGKKIIQLKAGAVGSIIKIAVTATRTGSAFGEKTLSIISSHISLPWFAETLTPVWYQGKALPVPHSLVNIIAIPEIVLDGRRIAPENLIYRWSYDDQDDALVGVGEQTFRVQTSDLPHNAHRVKLVLQDLQKRIYKQKEIAIINADPTAVIYTTTPAGGIASDRAVDVIQATQASGRSDVQVEPFFFPVPSKKSLAYQWTIGDQQLSGAPISPYFLTIDTRIASSGETPVTASVSYPGSLLSRVVKSFSIILP